MGSISIGSADETNVGSKIVMDELSDQYRHIEYQLPSDPEAVTGQVPKEVVVGVPEIA